MAAIQQVLLAYGGSAAPTGHRYWRINVTALNGDVYVGIAELEMRETSGGTDVTSGGTGSASTSYPGLTAPAAFDDNATTDWASDGSALPQWLKYDFGSGVSKDIVEIQITNRTGSYGPNQSPKDFDVQWSDDDSSWTTAFSITNSTGWTSGQRRYFNATGGYNSPPLYEEPFDSQRFWRIKTTAVDGGGVFALEEIQMRVTPTGSDECTGGTPYASSTIEGTPAGAFDDTTGYWAATDITNAWIGYLLPSAKSISTISIKARSSFYNQSPKDFLVQYWNGSSYTTVMTLTGITGWTASQVRWFDSTGEISEP